MEKVSIDQAIHFKNNGERTKALEALAALTKSEAEADRAWYHLGLMAAEDGDPERAIGCYKSALDNNPGYYRAANNLGTLLLEEKKYSPAYHYFDMAHQAAPGDLLPVYNMAQAAFGLRDFRTAVAHFTEVRNMTAFLSLTVPQQQELLLMMGHCYLELKIIDKAYAMYEEVSWQPSPSQVEALNNLAFICLEIRKAFAEAEKWVDKALSIDPRFKPSVQNKGLILKRMGRYSEAELFLQRVIELDPEGFEGYYNIACLNCSMNNEAEARKAIEKAIELAPGIRDYLKQDPDFTIYQQKSWFRALSQ